VPPFGTMLCREPAVLWPFVRSDGRGRPVVGPPQDVKVRTRYAPSAGASASSASATLVLDTEVDGPIIGSVIWTDDTAEGVTTADLVGGRPDPEFGWLMEILDWNEVRDVKGREARVEYQAGFFRKDLPTVEA
jgi:hypothetical protein